MPPVEGQLALGVLMRKSWAALVVTATLVVACTPEPAQERETSPAVERVTRYLDDAFERKQFRGAVEIRKGDEVLVSRGYGEADVDAGTPIDTDTRFRIASVTKQFTGLAVLILQEQGKLSLTSPVCAYLASCPAAWRAITLEQLLTHTSGLFNYLELSPEEVDRFLARIGTSTPSPEQLVQTFAGRSLEFAPGTRSQYSNSGYVLVGLAIERVSGLDYGEFLRKEILDPLGMSDSGYLPDEDTARYAVRYHDWTTPADALDDTLAYAAGGMYSTAADLARWNEFLMNGDVDVVKRETHTQFLEPRVEADAMSQYGYGIQSRDTADDMAYYHQGGLPGVAAYIEVHPATKLSVVMLSNLDLPNADGFTQNLISLLKS